VANVKPQFFSKGRLEKLLPIAETIQTSRREKGFASKVCKEFKVSGKDVKFTRLFLKEGLIKIEGNRATWTVPPELLNQFLLGMLFCKWLKIHKIDAHHLSCQLNSLIEEFAARLLILLPYRKRGRPRGVSPKNLAKIVCILPEAKTFAEIKAKTSLHQNTIAKCLRMLVELNIVSKRKYAKRVFYELSFPDGIMHLKRFMLLLTLEKRVNSRNIRKTMKSIINFLKTIDSYIPEILELADKEPSFLNKPLHQVIESAKQYRILKKEKKLKHLSGLRWEYPKQPKLDHWHIDDVYLQIFHEVMKAMFIIWKEKHLQQFHTLISELLLKLKFEMLMPITPLLASPEVNFRELMANDFRDFHLSMALAR
jgi:DNA-binding transcriptional regulator YhcF (GntR family)